MKQWFLVLALFIFLFGILVAQSDDSTTENENMMSEEIVEDEGMMDEEVAEDEGMMDEEMAEDEGMMDEEMAEDEMMHSSEEMAEDEMSEGEEMTMIGSSEPTPEELAGWFLELINDQAYEYTWHYEPGVAPGFYEGIAPHGAILRTFTNDIAYDAIQDKVNPLPEGSIIVKENYTPERELAAITFMVRMDGYNPDGGDWYWAKVQPDGTVEAAGSPAGCIGCHGGKRDNGWLFNASLQ